MESATLTKTKWSVDPAHSNVQFKIKHLVISTVTGHFDSFQGSAQTNGDHFENADVEFSIDVDSINTGNDQRDNHLRSDDFFNAEKYPQIKFKSKKIEKLSDEEYKMVGDLTIRDVTKEVTLDVEHGGTTTDPYGQKKAGFEVRGKINRKEFKLNWDAVTEAGNVVVSDQVRMIIDIQWTAEQA